MAAPLPTRREFSFAILHDIGDHLAIMMNNNEDYFVVCWAAQRLGLIYTPINWHLAASEVADNRAGIAKLKFSSCRKRSPCC